MRNVAFPRKYMLQEHCSWWVHW